MDHATHFNESASTAKLLCVAKQVVVGVVVVVVLSAIDSCWARTLLIRRQHILACLNQKSHWSSFTRERSQFVHQKVFSSE